MDFFETIKNRRSCRKFTNETIPDSVIEKSFNAALLAPNSSNLQAWEFFWVKNTTQKNELIHACFSQSAARTASDLVVAISRIDTWKRNKKLLLEAMNRNGRIPELVQKYYNFVVPLSYFQDYFGIFGALKFCIFTLIGFLKPVPRGPLFRSDVFEVVTKSTALACENFMLAITAQGYDSCPMEGFDENRVKKILGLNRNCHVVMVIGLGKQDSTGIYGEQIRLPSDLFIKKI